MTASAGCSNEEVLEAIEKACEGVTYMSEEDWPFETVSADMAPGETITEETMRVKLARYVDGNPSVDEPLSSLYGMTRSWQGWRDGADGCPEPVDPKKDPNCVRLKNLDQVLEDLLTDLQVYYFGSVGEPGRVDGLRVSIFVVGRTAAGQLAGVRTIGIWT